MKLNSILKNRSMQTISIIVVFCFCASMLSYEMLRVFYTFSVLMKDFFEMRIWPFLLMCAPHSFWQAPHVHKLYEKYCARVFCSLFIWGVESRTTNAALYSVSKISSGVRARCEGSSSRQINPSMSSLTSCLLLYVSHCLWKESDDSNSVFFVFPHSSNLMLYVVHVFSIFVGYVPFLACRSWSILGI